MIERVAIVGSRAFLDLSLVRAFVAGLPDGTVVISGGAKGVDAAAEAAARARGLYVESIRPKWAEFGRAAGAIRNWQIVQKADRVVAFWDGVSRGTAITIAPAKAKGIDVQVRMATVQT